MRRLLPRSLGLPRYFGGSASALRLSRPAQALLTLRPAGSLSRPRRPSSRGFSPLGCPTKPLVSYRINRQLSGWLLPPLVTHALGAHKIQSGSNGSARWERRSHAAPAELAGALLHVRRTRRAQSLYCANQPRPAPYLYVQGQETSRSGATKRLRPTTHCVVMAGPVPAISIRMAYALADLRRHEIEAHRASFNLLNPLICGDASSSVRTSDLPP
jgi:hypothetical protein